MPPARPPGTLRLPPIRRIALAAPFDWLALGWRDLWRIGLPSLLHGLVLAAFGALLLLIARDRFWLLAGAFSGFLVVAPVLATSLYALSRALERGEPADLQTVTKTWTRWQYSRYAVHGGYWSLVRFGVLLALAGPRRGGAPPPPVTPPGRPPVRPPPGLAPPPGRRDTPPTQKNPARMTPGVFSMRFPPMSMRPAMQHFMIRSCPSPMRVKLQL